MELRRRFRIGTESRYRAGNVRSHTIHEMMEFAHEGSVVGLRALEQRAVRNQGSPRIHGKSLRPVRFILGQKSLNVCATLNGKVYRLKCVVGSNMPQRR